MFISKGVFTKNLLFVLGIITMTAMFIFAAMMLTAGMLMGMMKAAITPISPSKPSVFISA